MVEYSRLDEVCSINMGQSPDSKSYNENGDGLPFFQGNADFGEMHPSVRVWCNAPKKVVEPGTLLISVRAPIGALNFTQETSCIGRGLAGINPKENVIIKYIYYCLMGKRNELNMKGTGSTFKAIAKEALAETLVRMAQFSEQLEVASALDSVASIISIRKQQLSALDSLIKARFVEMFGDDYPTVKLGDVCRMINGDRGKNYPSSDDFVSEGVPFINAGHLQNRTVNLCDMNYITEEKYALLSQGKIMRNDVLYCLRGSLGKHGLVPFEYGAIASSLVIIRCDADRILPQFLLYAIETPEIERQLKEANNGSSQPNLSAASVKAYSIKLPPLKEQRKFVTFIAAIDKSKAVVQEALQKAQLLFDSLMQKYFG